MGVASLIGWLVTQAQIKARAQRAELRYRRKRAILAARYIYRLESALAAKDLPLPDPPDGYGDDESTEGELW